MDVCVCVCMQNTQSNEANAKVLFRLNGDYSYLIRTDKFRQQTVGDRNKRCTIKNNTNNDNNSSGHFRATVTNL